MPKEQLAEFTLELEEVQNLNQQDTVNSWKRNGRGPNVKDFEVCTETTLL